MDTGWDKLFVQNFRAEGSAVTKRKNVSELEFNDHLTNYSTT